MHLICKGFIHFYLLINQALSFVALANRYKIEQKTKFALPENVWTENDEIPTFNNWALLSHCLVCSKTMSTLLKAHTIWS